MRFFSLALAIFSLDSLIKYKVEKPEKCAVLLQGSRDGMAAGESFDMGDLTEETKEKEIWHHTIILRKHHNKGVCLNIMDSHQKLVALASGIVTGLVAWKLGRLFRDKEQTGLQTGLAMILGGALSNTYDRVRRGYVVDYFSINTKWKPLRQIIFNISDFAIFIGCIIAGLFHK